MPHQKIPVEPLTGQPPGTLDVLPRHGISGVTLKYVTLPGADELVDTTPTGHRIIYLFIGGEGSVTADEQEYTIVPETILLPNAAPRTTIKATAGSHLRYLRILNRLTAQDEEDLKLLPQQNTQSVYCAKFADCPSYVEPIKSPNTVSRTILSNKYIPRVAMGTVQTIGPDEVGAHEHPMLEQLFLGLADNACTFYADNDQVAFPAYSLLHVPLGSRHSVSVAGGETMYYVWMDFFLDKRGEEWLKTHREN